MKKSELKQLIKEILSEVMPSTDDMKENHIDQWGTTSVQPFGGKPIPNVDLFRDAMQKSKIYNIEHSSDSKKIIIKFVDGAVVTFSSPSAIQISSPKHMN